ncbi:hypothetical protein Tco_1072847, partial [Tanacetum coccineum]
FGGVRQLFGYGVVVLMAVKLEDGQED